jgi:hypothetical protein
MNNIKLTSVKVLKSLYNSFKVEIINSNITLQKLANRSMYLYLNDTKFKDRIETTDQLIPSGSNF